MSLLGSSLSDILERLEKKEFSPLELFDYFLTRSKKYNARLNAYLTFGEEAGIPIAVKDNFCTKGLRTTASSKVLDAFIPPYDSTVTHRLKQKGYGILGKTNMDAWAHGSSTETSDYGVTRNPWSENHVAGGSSGGSAAAVSAYLSPVAIGSETAGSIRGPAAWCGIVGLKPTYGRVSRYGVVAMGSSLDCPGPLTLTVKDAALMLEIISGHDSFDATSANVPALAFSRNLEAKKKLTIGVPKEYFRGVEDAVSSQTHEAIRILEKMGHTVKEVSLLDPKYAISVYTIIQRAEVSSNLARYTGVRYGADRSFFGEEAKRRIMLGTYTLSYGYYDAFYKKAQKVRTMIMDDFKKAFKSVDLIVSPTMPMTATKIGEIDNYPFFGERMDVLSEPSSVAGLPAISVPVGLTKTSLPVGMQLIGNYFDEETILGLAHQFERETNFFGVIRQGTKHYPD